MDASRKVGVIGIRTQVLEREHRDGIWQYLACDRRDPCDRAVTAFGDGLNVLRLPRIITKRTPNLGDVAGDADWFDSSTVPDLSYEFFNRDNLCRVLQEVLQLLGVDKTAELLEKLGPRHVADSQVDPVEPPPDEELPPGILELDKKIEDLSERKDQAVIAADYELAAELRDEMERLRRERRRLRKRWLDNQGQER